MAAIEAKVQKLIDIEEIRNLRFRYHVAMNERTFDDIPDLFTNDAELDFDYLGQAKGREKLSRFFAETPKILTFLKQFIHNHVVEVNGDCGTGYCYLEARTVSNGTAYNVAARYNDEYVRVNGEWRFGRMSLEPYFTLPFDEGWAQDDCLKMAKS